MPAAAPSGEAREGDGDGEERCPGRSRPSAAKTTMLTMSRTAKIVVIVRPEAPLVEVPGLQHEHEGRAVDAGGHRQRARQRAAGDVETGPGVAQVEAPGDHHHGDEHGDADDDAQPAVVGAQEHEQPDRQADRGAGEHPPGDAAIGVVAPGHRLVAVRERGQPEGHDDGVVGIEDDRQQRHGGQAEPEAGRQLDGAATATTSATGAAAHRHRDRGRA